MSSKKRIAALYTCFNRKDKTLESLSSLFKATNQAKDRYDVVVYLTDDGSTDGTSEAVNQEFPQVKVLQGSGDLFWAKGMNHSWEAALVNEKWDGFLLLNDDTNVFENLFEQIDLTDQYSQEKHGLSGVYVGSTKDQDSDEISYGGSIIHSRWRYTFSKRIPNGTPQTCELGNANIMYVSNSVVEKIGVLSKGYAHGVADYDYTLSCLKKKLPVLVMPEFCGTCKNDHRSMYHNFENMSFKERLNYLYHPLGVDFKSRLQFMRKFFPMRYPIFYLVGWFKVLMPKTYKSLLGRS